MLRSFTDQELKERRDYIGGSDAPIIYHGEHFGKTVLTLWEEKTGRREPECLDDKLNVQMGTWTEELNRLWFERKTKLTVDKSDDLCYVKHYEHPFIRGHLDGVVLGPDGIGCSVWEAKHTKSYQHRRKEFVRLYYPQLQHLILSSGYEKSYISVFVGNSDWYQKEVPKDEDFQKELLDKELEFWYCVEMEVEPRT